MPGARGAGSRRVPRGAPAPVRSPYRPWLGLVLAEKTVQHAFVTFAMVVDLHDIRSTVAVSPDVLAVAGAGLALVAALGCAGVLRDRRGAPALAALLAVADVVGEFVAQGTVFITLNVSFAVAVALLALLVLERRNRAAGGHAARSE